MSELDAAPGTAVVVTWSAAINTAFVLAMGRAFAIGFVTPAILSFVTVESSDASMGHAAIPATLNVTTVVCILRVVATVMHDVSINTICQLPTYVCNGVHFPFLTGTGNHMLLESGCAWLCMPRQCMPRQGLSFVHHIVISAPGCRFDGCRRNRSVHRHARVGDIACSRCPNSGIMRRTATPVTYDVAMRHCATPVFSAATMRRAATPETFDVAMGHRATPVTYDVAMRHAATPETFDVAMGHCATPVTFGVIIEGVIMGHDATRVTPGMSAGHASCPGTRGIAAW